MKLKLCKIRVSFTRNINVLNYQYTLGNVLVLQSECVKDLEAHIDCKLILIIMLIFLFSHAVKLLGLIRAMAFSFSTMASLPMLYFALVRSKPEYTSVAGNSYGLQ
jgi:hypothetical protein